MLNYIIRISLLLGTAYSSDVFSTQTCDAKPEFSQHGDVNYIYSDDILQTCSTCMSGYATKIINEWETCVICEDGSYELDNVCYDCPAGTYAIYHRETCRMCDPASKVATEACCPKKSYFDILPGDSLLTCIPCPSGYVSDAAQRKCSVCDENFYLHETNQCVQCYPGTVSDMGNTDCRCESDQCCDPENNVIVTGHSIYLQNFSACEHATVTYDNELMPIDRLYSSVQLSIMPTHPVASEVIIYASNTPLFKISCDYYKTKTEHGMELFFDRNNEKQLFQVHFKRVWNVENMCRIYTNNVHVGGDIECAKLATHFEIKGNLVHIYSVYLLYEGVLFVLWNYKDGDVCVDCPENTVVVGNECMQCYSGVLVDVDTESVWWKQDMWSGMKINENTIDYYPQWTNQNDEKEGIMRYNDYVGEGNLYFSPLDTYDTKDNLKRVCEHKTETFVLDLNIVQKPGVKFSD